MPVRKACFVAILSLLMGALSGNWSVGEGPQMQFIAFGNPASARQSSFTAMPPSSLVGIRAITRPSADITQSFIQPGRIAHVPVKEGDAVKAGQVLIRQDDVAEQILLAQLKAQKEDLIQIRASEASLAQKRVDLAKLEKAAASNAATALEVEHARLNVTIAELSLDMAKFEHEQAGRKYQEHRIRVEHMELRSPINGWVEKIEVEVGECVNATTEVIRVVQTDPLWIDVPVPLTQGIDLKAGQAARVVFGGSDPQTHTEAGQIIFVAAVADAASGTLRIRLEVPNKTRRPAGEHVLVAF
jgi:RND family efflux transporter MFP subunit